MEILHARFEMGGQKIKSINIFLGFFFIVNFCLGTGFLGVPYAFFYSGYLAAVPTLLLVTVISWINANYLLEVMARAQVSSRSLSPLPFFVLNLGRLL